MTQQQHCLEALRLLPVCRLLQSDASKHFCPMPQGSCCHQPYEHIPASNRAAAGNSPGQAFSNSPPAAGRAKAGSPAVRAFKALLLGSSHAAPLPAAAVQVRAPLVVAEDTRICADGMAASDELASLLQADSKPAAHASSSHDYREAISKLSMIWRFSTLGRPRQPVRMPTSKPAAEQVQRQYPFAGMGLDGRTAAAPPLPNQASVDLVGLQVPVTVQLARRTEGAITGTAKQYQQVATATIARCCRPMCSPRSSILVRSAS